MELNIEAAKGLGRGMGAGGKIRFEVKEKEIKEGGKMKAMIRLIKTFERGEKGKMRYTPMRKNNE